MQYNTHEINKVKKFNLFNFRIMKVANLKDSFTQFPRDFTSQGCNKRIYSRDFTDKLKLWYNFAWHIKWLLLSLNFPCSSSSALKGES